MDKHILFIHSAGPQGPGEGSNGLIAFLRNKLDGYVIHSPLMPAPENPQYSEWKTKLTNEFAQLPNGTILIGHSIGGSALLKYFLEEDVSLQIPMLISVASPFWGMNEQWQLEDFVISNDSSSWNKQVPAIILMHSIGDPIVPFAHLERYMEVLSSPVIKKIPGRDHVFENGLDELVEIIRSGKDKESG